jgi:hypothetical protein
VAADGARDKIHWIGGQETSAGEPWEEGAAKARIRAKIFQLAEEWFASQEEVADTADFRRMVQIVLDLGESDPKGEQGQGERGVVLLPAVMEAPEPPQEQGTPQE